MKQRGQKRRAVVHIQLEESGNIVVNFLDVLRRTVIFLATSWVGNLCQYVFIGVTAKSNGEYFDRVAAFTLRGMDLADNIAKPTCSFGILSIGQPHDRSDMFWIAVLL